MVGSVSRVEATAASFAALAAKMPSGTRFPSESALVTRFKVSRVVVREAFARLKADGLIRSEKGRGHFVVKPVVASADQTAATLDSRSMLQLLELRAALETHAAALAARRRSADDLRGMEEALRRMAGAIGRGDIEEGVQADLAFHGAIVAASGNDYFRRSLEAVNEPLLGFVRQARLRSQGRSGQGAQAQDEHQAIFEAIRSGNSRRARAASQRHIDNTSRRLAASAGPSRGDEVDDFAMQDLKGNVIEQ